jgi:sarcosine oxidase
VATTPPARSSATFGGARALLARVRSFLSEHVPTTALGPIIYTKTCLYTLTPGHDFIQDTLPGRPDALVAIGGGPGFKFTCLIRRILSELALDGDTRHDIAPFRIDRPTLALANFTS